MVRSVITVNALIGGFMTPAAADAMDKTNDHEATPTKKHIMFLFHLSTATAADTIKIIKGASPPALRSSIGDLTFSAAGGAEEAAMGPVESGRYKQSDGKIYIDLAGTSIAGTIEAYEFN